MSEKENQFNIFMDSVNESLSNGEADIREVDGHRHVHPLNKICIICEHLKNLKLSLPKLTK